MATDGLAGGSQHVDGSKAEQSPYPVNPAGFTIHSAVHGSRADAHCVVYLHTVQGHGTLTVGETVSDAWLRMYMLERVDPGFRN